MWISPHWMVWFVSLIGGGTGDDILCLTNGQILEGVALERTEGAIVVHFSAGDVRVPQDQVLEAIIAGDAGFVPETDEEKAKVADGYVRYEGEWVKKEKRDKDIAERVDKRKKYIAEIREKTVWRNRWTSKTRNFEFEHTVPEDTFEPYRDLMEAYFKEFKSKWKIKKPRGHSRLKVCFYTDRQSFQRTGGVGGGVAGYFRFVEPVELNMYYDRLDPRFTELVLFHEANHYLQKLINWNFSYPHFPGESLAEYYGASTWDPAKKKLETGLIQEGRLAEIQTDIARDELMPLEKLLSSDRMYEHYTWGWSLVHFLMNDNKRSKKFQAFFVALANDKNVKRVVQQGTLTTVEQPEVVRVFREFLGVTSDDAFKELEKEWHDYVKGQTAVSARGLEMAAFQAAGSNPSRPIRARRLFSEAIAAGLQSPKAYHRYAELQMEEKNYSEAFSLWAKAIELDPLNPEYYAAMARAEKTRGNSEKAKKLMNLAREIDPDAYWIEREYSELLED
ncbi:MAG: tetratricopeptide repeat protein [Planctomycetes bacterium]|nr:tetratricopeptide repeat protein [Planctomycetota bacterium]